MKPTKSENIFNIFNVTLMAVFAFVCLYPIIYITALSFNDGGDAMRGGIYFLPRTFTLENYYTIFRDDRLLRSTLISIFRTVTTICLITIFNSCFAFSLSKKKLPGRKIFNWFILIPMYFSGGIIPYFLVCRQLGLINNILVYVLPFLVNSFYIMMQRSFYAAMPESLDESAKIDGAGYFSIFFRIYFPLSLPILATVALLTGVDQWNDWFTGSILAMDPKFWPLQTLLLNIIQNADMAGMMKARSLASMAGKGVTTMVTVESVKMAVLVFTVAPIALIYPFFQKYFIKGILLGSVKG